MELDDVVACVVCGRDGHGWRGCPTVNNYVDDELDIAMDKYDGRVRSLGRQLDDAHYEHRATWEHGQRMKDQLNERDARVKSLENEIDMQKRMSYLERREKDRETAKLNASLAELRNENAALKEEINKRIIVKVKEVAPAIKVETDGTNDTSRWWMGWR
jgi:chromosome segregation ATPase